MFKKLRLNICNWSTKPSFKNKSALTFFHSLHESFFGSGPFNWLNNNYRIDIEIAPDFGKAKETDLNEWNDICRQPIAQNSLEINCGKNRVLILKIRHKYNSLLRNSSWWGTWWMGWLGRNKLTGESLETRVWRNPLPTVVRQKDLEFYCRIKRQNEDIPPL